ncbi:hypothetical protein Ocin01_07798 [Orchesella cincta]|uniref:Uncharacterized protein n=1 Tax=Orchesella cincta TaxID=48709 RepID=A0A1D2N0Z5_ORCCI|nr:hypothetical protein Ocin01_07798 [Orchesella cincta]
MQIFNIIATLVAFACVVGAMPGDAPDKKEASASSGIYVPGTNGW